MKKIMFVASSLRYGGAEKMMSELVNNYATLKEDKEVYLFLYENCQINYNIEQNVKVIYPNREYKTRYLKRIISLFDIFNVIRRIKPDILISFLTNPNLYSTIVGKLLKIPVIISERGDPYTNTSFISRLKYTCYNYADVIVCQTEQVKDFFQKFEKPNKIVINNFIEKPASINYWKEINDYSICTVGRLDIHQKRQDILIKAFKNVNKIIPQSKLHIYGDGNTNDYNYLISLVNSLDLEENIVFHGKVDNILELISKHNLFLLTSDYEGIPNALLEAMSIGMPVISTKCSPGGAELLIENGVNGLLSERRDINKISSLILLCLCNHENSIRLGQNARNVTEKFSLNRIIDEWINLIKKTIKDE